MKPFLAACIAIGDCLVYSRFNNLPFDTSLGLRDIFRGGGDWTASWRGVLAGGKLLVVAPPPLSRQASISLR